MIYIYSDGVHSNEHLMIALQMTHPSHEIRFCNISMILDRCLDTCSLFVMPGGADLYYCEKLNGEGNILIEDFVAKGGSYLGICAGAYYACNNLNWNHGEISGFRELNFYPESAIGPVYQWLENSDSVYNGSWKKPVTIRLEGGSSFPTLYNGGPVFNKPQENGSSVIAHYTDLDDEPPAIIGGNFGNGKYILSSPHIEKFGHLLVDGLYTLHNKSYEREKAVNDILLPYEQAQKQFFKTIVDRLL